MDIQAAVPVKLEHGARMDLATFEMLVEQIPGKWPRFELFNGEVVEVTLPNFGHSQIASVLVFFLNMYLMPRKERAASSEAGLKPIGYSENTYLIPAVSYFSKTRYPLIKHKGNPIGAPDIAIEVFSPSNSEEGIVAKAQTYIRGGTQLVWVVYSTIRKVAVYRADGTYAILEPDGTLDGGNVLPDFRLDLKEFWNTVDEGSEE